MNGAMAVIYEGLGGGHTGVGRGTFNADFLNCSCEKVYIILGNVSRYHEVT